MHARTVQLAINQLKHLVISLSRVMGALKTDHEMNLNQEILKHFCNTEKKQTCQIPTCWEKLVAQQDETHLQHPSQGELDSKETGFKMRF